MAGADAKVWVADANITVYIDLSVICGPITRPVHHANAATDPAPVIEVLSPGTAAHDRGDRHRAYMRAPTVQHIVFVASDRVEGERCVRVNDGAWEVRTAGPRRRAWAAYDGHARRDRRAVRGDVAGAGCWLRAGRRRDGGRTGFPSTPAPERTFPPDHG